MKIFVINPGSTSTKIALFIDEKPVWAAGAHHTADDLSEFHHVNEQYAYRKDFVLRLLAEADIPLDFDAVIARGGLLKPTPGGVYAINEQMKHDLLNARMEHACNLGALIADEIARECHCPAYIADPEVVDELQPAARLTGIPEIERISIFHALNSKAVSRKYAASIGKHYEELNLIVVHLGGGISVGAHCKGRVIDVNNALNGEGPFSPERAGTIPADQLAELCFSVIVISYTNKAIGELRDRINKGLGIPAKICTFHAFAYDIVKQFSEEPPEINFSSQQIIFDMLEKSIFHNKQLMRNLVLFLGYYFDLSEDVFKFTDLNQYHLYKAAQDFETLKSGLGEYIKKVEQQRTKKTRTITGEYLRSMQEVQIANFLYFGSRIKYQSCGCT